MKTKNKMSLSITFGCFVEIMRSFPRKSPFYTHLTSMHTKYVRSECFLAFTVFSQNSIMHETCILELLCIFDISNIKLYIGTMSVHDINVKD